MARLGSRGRLQRGHGAVGEQIRLITQDQGRDVEKFFLLLDDTCSPPGRRLPGRQARRAHRPEFTEPRPPDAYALECLDRADQIPPRRHPGPLPPLGDRPGRPPRPRPHSAPPNGPTPHTTQPRRARRQCRRPGGCASATSPSYAPETSHARSCHPVPRSRSCCACPSPTTPAPRRPVLVDAPARSATAGTAHPQPPTSPDCADRARPPRTRFAAHLTERATGPYRPQTPYGYDPLHDPLSCRLDLHTEPATGGSSGPRCSRSCCSRTGQCGWNRITRTGRERDHAHALRGNRRGAAPGRPDAHPPGPRGTAPYARWPT